MLVGWCPAFTCFVHAPAPPGFVCRHVHAPAVFSGRQEQALCFPQQQWHLLLWAIGGHFDLRSVLS
eukprot:1160936-Pelagomonas_calceolata.AAC.15